MIVVFGAAGKTGQRVVAALARRGATIRAQVRRPEQQERLHRLGAAEVVVGELGDPTTLTKACNKAKAVYLMAPNMYVNEPLLVAAAITLAKQARVKRIVYHSVLHPQIEAMPHHWAKLSAEEMLFRIGISFTILQPAAYMQNVLPQLRLARETGVFRMPYKPTTRLGMVDLEDVAEVAAMMLTQTGHFGAIYELAGAEVLTQHQVAAIMGDVLGRTVSAEREDRVQWAEQARLAGLGEYAVSTLVKMFEYYEAYGFWGNPHVLRGLLGREPTTFKEFLEREAGVDKITNNQ